MGKLADVESVTPNFIGQTDAPANKISDYMAQEKLYCLKKRPIPYQLRLSTQLLQIQAAQKQSAVKFCFNAILIAEVTDKDKDKINIDRSSNSFKFDDSKIIKSNRLVTILVFIGGVQARLSADVIDYEISLLLSKDSLKKANAMVDFKNDNMIFFQKTVESFTLIHVNMLSC